MSIELTEDLRTAVESAGTPIKIVDPQSGQVYVLVKESAFARWQSLLVEELSETYPAQIESALRAGWNDPAMGEYNDYDRHRPS